MLKISDVTFSVPAGYAIDMAISDAVKFAQEHTDNYNKPIVRFEFNGVKVSVHGDSDSELIERDWSRAMEGCIAKSVGPYPEATLSTDELESDKAVYAANNARRRAYHDQQRARDVHNRRKLALRLDGAPAMEFSADGRQYWEAAVVANGQMTSYPANWARLMQLEIGEGALLEDIAERTSLEANVDGITGAMYGFFVDILTECWVYGERLRVWHNAKYGVGEHEEGVVDPAFLTFEPQ